MFVIGTAGHVDHGKSTLVHALSGINPDRLREEQRRQMTIDLGFAWLTLPSGREISIVDVPGHEDFIKNMLAGVGGIDLALLVVAADEAVMPQTREHLHILDLLRVPRGVIALTKADLVDDPVWLDLVSEEIRETVAGTTLQDAPIVPVSAVTGQGLPELLQAIDEALSQIPPREDLGFPRLSIDRAFTISGFGTVVTGTLVGGCFRVEDTVEILPGGLTARIRGLQSHKTKIDQASPGMRVAVNLGNVSVNALRRGQVLALPGMLQETRLLDVHLQVLADAPWPLEHGMLVDFFTGAANTLGRLRLLEVDSLAPGEEGWAQIRLREPVAVARYDRFILRLPSPSVTLGGGAIVEPHPIRKHRRQDAHVIARLKVLAQGAADLVLEALLEERGPMMMEDLIRQSLMPRPVAEPALHTLLDQGRVLALDGLLITARAWQAFKRRAIDTLGRYHRQYRLRRGMSREAFRSQLRLDAKQSMSLIEAAEREGWLWVSNELVALADHTVELTEAEQIAVEKALALFAAQPFSPPPLSEIEEVLGSELLQYLFDSGRLVRLGESAALSREAFEEMEKRLHEHLQAHGTITVAEFRDLVGTSRKYAVAFLEEMDRRRITRRMGDIRVLRQG